MDIKLKKVKWYGKYGILTAEIGGGFYLIKSDHYTTGYCVEHNRKGCSDLDRKTIEEAMAACEAHALGRIKQDIEVEAGPEVDAILDAFEATTLCTHRRNGVPVREKCLVLPCREDGSVDLPLLTERMKSKTTRYLTCPKRVT